MGRLVDSEGLTVREAQFVNAFKGNATEAAKIAGYKRPSDAGARLLRRKMIAMAIGRRMVVSAEKAEITRDELMQTLTEIVRENTNPVIQMQAMDRIIKLTGWGKQDQAQGIPLFVMKVDEGEGND